jgi:dsRNA-specific ribonuclease
MNSEIEGYYETCIDCDNQTIFSWKSSRLEITDKRLSRSDGDYAKGWVKMDRHDFIYFLLKSDFLRQHGYKIVKNSGKDDSSKDFNVEIKVNGQIITVEQRQKVSEKD